MTRVGWDACARAAEEAPRVEPSEQVRELADALEALWRNGDLATMAEAERVLRKAGRL